MVWHGPALHGCNHQTISLKLLRHATLASSHPAKAVLMSVHWAEGSLSITSAQIMSLVEIMQAIPPAVQVMTLILTMLLRLSMNRLLLMSSMLMLSHAVGAVVKAAMTALTPVTATVAAVTLMQATAAAATQSNTQWDSELPLRSWTVCLPVLLPQGLCPLA